MLPSSTSTDSSIISSSASSSSSSSPFSHLPNTKTMEEVWKDINITSLPNTLLPHNHYININIHHNNHNNNNHVIHHPTPTTNFRGMILQDFLNCNNPSIRAVDSHQVHAPITTLKLTNEFQQILEPNNNEYQMQATQNYSAFGTFDALASSSVLTSFGGGGDVLARKRSSESTPEDVHVDRRNKRMLKNRESAARSRARKQAYITELELEVAHLAAENTRLRKQQQQLLEAPSTQQPKKKGLHRTLTAPF